MAQPSFARNCLLARRLVERGVRFVQLFHGDWDHHSNIGQRICRASAGATDQPSAALVNDLQARGACWTTRWSFGAANSAARAVAQGPRDAAVGRDHNIDAFTMWLAGGGVQGRAKPSARTDELGCFAVEDSLHIYDLQATILHLLGLRPQAADLPLPGPRLPPDRRPRQRDREAIGLMHLVADSFDHPRRFSQRCPP